MPLKTNWVKGETVTPADLNAIGEAVNTGGLPDARIAALVDDPTSETKATLNTTLCPQVDGLNCLHRWHRSAAPERQDGQPHHERHLSAVVRRHRGIGVDGGTRAAERWHRRPGAHQGQRNQRRLGTPTAADALARKRPVTDRRRSLPGIVTKIALPAGLNWLDAPIRIFKDGARYVTDFDMARFKNVSGKTVYFDHIVGLTANDGLTEATPKKTLQECINLIADGDTIVMLSKGVYPRQSSIITNRIRKSFNLIAPHPGETTLSYFDALTYTQDATNTSVYTATRSNVAKVIDLGVGDSGDFEYTKVTTIAECEALAGS